MSKQSETSTENKKNPRLNKTHLLIYMGAFSICIILIIFALWLFLIDKIYPRIAIAGNDVSFRTYPQAKENIEKILQERLNKTIQFTYTNSTSSAQPVKYELELSSDEIVVDISTAVYSALEYGHKTAYTSKINIPLQATFKPSFDYKLAKIAQSINQTPLDSQIKMEDEQIIVTPSQDGVELDETDIKEKITQYINTGTITNLNLTTKKAPPKLSYNTALKVKKRLDLIKLQPLKLTFKEQVFSLDLSQVISFIDLDASETSLASFRIFNTPINISTASVGNSEIIDTKIALNSQKTSEFFKQLSSQINQEVQEPLFSVEQTSDPEKPKITEFRPPVEGRTLDVPLSKERLTNAILNPDVQTIELPVLVISPKNKLANDYGIKELIGRGVSNFAGSITNRIFNVNHAAAKINGILISPGEEFSFVNTVGDISAATGYKQAYVIKSGRTVLDDGGGVCQVSTTIFRAALNSGLPITARTAHAYRVSYYEQGYPPGLDATIFHPSVDFKFKNDTTHHILVQSYTNGTTLYVDFYGTSDGRVANLTKPVILSQTPPLPELRQDDPTLPKGTIKQVDFPAWGANVVFSRTVTRNGETLINESFKSNYRPWQAVYLVGTKEG